MFSPPLPLPISSICFPFPGPAGPSPAPFGWSLAIPPVQDPFSLTAKCLQLPAPSSLILKWFPPVSAQRIPQSGGGLSMRRGAARGAWPPTHQQRVRRCECKFT